MKKGEEVEGRKERGGGEKGRDGWGAVGKKKKKKKKSKRKKKKKKYFFEKK